MRPTLLAASLLALATAMVSIPAPSLAGGDAAALCATPRTAIASFLDNLQPASFHTDLATTCFDFSGGPAAAAERIEKAQDLLAILDGQGKFVDYKAVPADPAYSDPKSGLSRYVLFPSLPEIYLEKSGGQWKISAFTVATTKALFQRTYRVPLLRVAQRLPAPLRDQVLGVALWKWAGLALLAVLALILAKVGEILGRGLLRRTIRSFTERWDEEVERRVLSRANLLLMAGIVAILLPNLAFPVRFNQILFVALKLCISVAAILILNAVVDLVFDTLGQKAAGTDTKMDDQVLPLLRRAAKALVLVVGSLFVLQNLDVDVASLIAGLGLGGLAFALAAKDTLANLFGSVTVFADRPFQIGDWVVIGGVEGIIEEVGFRSTRVRTFYDSVVTIPNSRMTDTTIDNKGRRRYRRFKTTLGLTYDATPDQVQAFVEGVRASIQASPYTRKEAYEVHFFGLGAHSLDVLVYCFFEVSDWTDELKGRHALLLEWMRLAESLGLGFAFPTQTLHVETLAGAGKVALPPVPTHPMMAETVTAFGPGGQRSQPETKPFTNGYWPSKD